MTAPRLHRLKNGSWIQLFTVTAIHYSPKHSYLLDDNKFYPDKVNVICGNACHTIEFESADEAMAYADELAEMINDRIWEKSSSEDASEPK